jgi:hypothetical protein
MRQPPRSNKPPREKPPVAAGSEPKAGDESGSDLPLPHERDEAPHASAPRPDPQVRQAGKDLEAGQVDTDMRATPGLDAQRRERLVPGAGGRIRRRG